MRKDWPVNHSHSPYLTPYLRCTGRLQPPLRFDHDGSGRRQPLNLCSPLHGKPSVADLEDYPLDDYILSSTPLRKLDDALHRMRSFVRRTAIPAWSAFLGCELPHCYRSTILAFSYSRHQCSSSMLSHPSSTSPLLLRRPYASSATVIHDSVKAGLGDCSSPLATIT